MEQQVNHLYFVITELKYQLRTSLLIWCYLICVLMVYFPHFMAFLLLDENLSIQSLIFGFVLVSIFFGPINSDIFFREIGFNIQDFLLMKTIDNREIIISRIIANGILLICPQFVGCLLILFKNALIMKSLPINLLLFSMINILSILVFWFLFGLFLYLIMEFKGVLSSKRTIIYYFVVFIFTSFIVGITIIICQFCNFLNDNFDYNISEDIQFILLDIFFARFAFRIAKTAYLFLLILCFLFLYITQRMIPVCCRRNTERILDSNRKNSAFNFYKLKYYSFLEALKTGRKNEAIIIIPFLLFMFISLFIDPVLLLSLLFTITSIYILFLLFPNIIIERHFNMEELMLSRITSSYYMKTKCKIILQGGFLPLFLPSLYVLVSTNFSSSPLVIILLFCRLWYVTSILFLLWRFLPSKNLFYTSIIAILMIDIIGILFIAFFTYVPDLTDSISLKKDTILLNSILTLSSPILSNVFVPAFMSNPDGTSLIISLMTSLGLSSLFFLVALLLLKADVRFE